MQENDEVIEQLKETITPILDKIDEDHDSPRACFVIAGKENIVDGEFAGIQTFSDCVGELGTIGEALYHELSGQLDENNPLLFNLLREVIKTIEQERDIPDDQPVLEERILH